MICKLLSCEEVITVEAEVTFSDSYVMQFWGVKMNPVTTKKMWFLFDAPLCNRGY